MKKTRRKRRAKGIPHATGVYQAVSPSGSYYIGRAVDMRERMYAHYSQAKRGCHSNKRFERTLNKYGNNMKWSVLIQTKTIDEALECEEKYLNMFWGDKNLINQKTGDEFTALDNERNKRKVKYAMNIWSGNYIRLNYRGEYGAKMIGKARHCEVPSSVYGDTVAECEKKRMQKLRADIRRHGEAQYASEPRRKKLYGYHIRNIHTGYVGYAKDVEELRSIGALASAHSQSNSFYNGWQVRRIGQHWSWFVPQVSTVAVFGLHVTGKTKAWKSRHGCQNELGKGAGKAIRGEAVTYKGWRLTAQPEWGV
jgi:predicted GIY-YIG superfamily endonuclease